MDTEKRYERQSELYNGQEKNVLIVGCGAVGRQVAIILATMGTKNITLCDFDVVDEVNLGAQGFLESDIGQYKTSATKRAISKVNSTVKVKTFNNPYEKDLLLPDVFCCVDKMMTRKEIYNDFISEDEIYSQGIFLDSRMAAEVARILVVKDVDGFLTHYEKELFTDDEKIEERCTARTTFYCANICAGLMISQYVKHHRGLDVCKDVCFDISQNVFLRR